ncbi:MAG: cytochrome c [Betaproteobacteria bacterium]|nr:cytochrome c [Betaproteobacteria bacterium]
MKRKLLLCGVAMVLGLGYGAAAFAQAKPDVQVKQRQAAMTLIGKYWGPIGGMATGKIPYNAATVTRNAGYLEVLSVMPWDGFTDATKDEKSRALPAVFSDNAKFRESADTFQKAAANLAKVSRGGDEGAVKSALAEVGKTCGGCHDNFRSK